MHAPFAQFCGPWQHATPRMGFDGRFSDPRAGATPWADTLSVLQGAELYWLTTVRADGRPHVTPLTAIWDRDAFWFCTGPTEQKAHNLAANQQVAVTTGANAWTAGTDVVVEGAAVRVIAAADLQRFADLMRDKYAGAWDYSVEGESVSPDRASLAGLFRVSPVKVLAFAKDPHAQTRYRFD